MPDDRIKRTRETLPKGYQFGDAAPPEELDMRVVDTIVKMVVSDALAASPKDFNRSFDPSWKQQ